MPKDRYKYGRLRDALLDDDTAGHKEIGPLEHGEMAEDFVRYNPILGPVAAAVAIPAYTAAKALGLHKARSPASVREMVEGYRGVSRGMYQNARQALGMYRDDDDN